MLTLEQHLDNLVRHIDLVREACLYLGKKLIASGRQDIGRLLISKGFVHDASKFTGIEWEYLHAGKDVPPEALKLAIRHHALTNSHHPEYFGGFDKMSELAILEMTADWFSRSLELGTGLRDWIEDVAIPKYKIDRKCDQYGWLMQAVDMLLENGFAEIRDDDDRTRSNKDTVKVAESTAA